MRSGAAEQPPQAAGRGQRVGPLPVGDRRADEEQADQDPDGTHQRVAVLLNHDSGDSQPRVALDRPVPTLPQLLPVGSVHLWLKFALQRPVPYHFAGVLPVSDGQACQVSSSQRRGFGDDGPADDDVEDVGLELHQLIVDRRTAVDVERVGWNLCVLSHRIQQIDGLHGHRFDRGAGHVAGRGAARDAEQRPRA